MRKLLGPDVSLTAPQDLHGFFANLRDHYVPMNLIRIGGDGDGGYLLPDLREDISHCFSPGISDIATFEEEIATSHGINSFMADASVTAPPTDNPHFHFQKKFLGSRDSGVLMTLKTWMETSVDPDDDSLLLQMDIEGAEYDVLTLESAETLRRFNCMVIEFHGVQEIFHANFFRVFSAIFDKIFQNFSICHLHPNNYYGTIINHGIATPQIMEITFVRNDMIAAHKTDGPIQLPHPLDRPNVAEKPDIIMPDIWWKS
ncbi:FkbM family methyltransferase [Roseovarius sp.]|uniref:FkbM family methyltransferase n=1 Tax=Roseovarius sp. TaxID=1486281 RepID=UPI00257B655C|nr:FkbM family methyltransferase [Roseovarius sp.]